MTLKMGSAFMFGLVWFGLVWFGLASLGLARAPATPGCLVAPSQSSLRLISTMPPIRSATAHTWVTTSKLSVAKRIPQPVINSERMTSNRPGNVPEPEIRFTSISLPRSSSVLSISSSNRRVQAPVQPLCNAATPLFNAAKTTPCNACNPYRYRGCAWTWLGVQPSVQRHGGLHTVYFRARRNPDRVARPQGSFHMTLSLNNCAIAFARFFLVNPACLASSSPANTVGA